MEVAESGLRALWTGTSAVDAQHALDQIQNVCEHVTTEVARALTTQCAMEDHNKVTVPPFTTNGLIFMFVNFFASCLVASIISVLVQRFPKKAYLIIYTPFVDFIELIGTYYILDTFTEAGCSARELIQVYLITMCAGCVTDLGFFIGWLWGSSVVPSHRTIRGIAIISAIAWGGFLFVAIVMYFAVRMSIGYEFGVEQEHDGVLNITPGIVLGVVTFIFGSINTASILMKDSTPPPPPAAPKKLLDIIKDSFVSILIWIWGVNGAVVFASSLVAAYASPIAAGLITGCPSGIWSSLVVLQRSGVEGDSASKFMITSSTYAVMSVVALLFYSNYGISLVPAACIGMGVAIVVVVAYWWLFLHRRQISGYGSLIKSSCGDATELDEKTGGKTSSYLRMLSHEG